MYNVSKRFLWAIFHVNRCCIRRVICFAVLTLFFALISNSGISSERQYIYIYIYIYVRQDAKSMLLERSDLKGAYFLLEKQVKSRGQVNTSLNNHLFSCSLTPLWNLFFEQEKWIEVKKFLNKNKEKWILSDLCWGYHAHWLILLPSAPFPLPFNQPCQMLLVKGKSSCPRTSKRHGCPMLG